jgi:ribosomal protein S18 acetylase RimI-like enzyme
MRMRFLFHARISVLAAVIAVAAGGFAAVAAGRLISEAPSGQVLTLAFAIGLAGVALGVLLQRNVAHRLRRLVQMLRDSGSGGSEAETAPEIVEMTGADYDEVLSLWGKSRGVGLGEADSQEGVELFLKRNPGLSLVSRDDTGALVGVVLCGHDGQRGYVHHLAVARPFRRTGLATQLLGACLESLRAAGIPECYAFVYSDNTRALNFFTKRLGWARLENVALVAETLATDSPRKRGDE